jgi:hypothetical protein
MSDISTLASRIDAEFTVVEEKAKKLHTERMEEQKEHQQRLEQLNKVFDELAALWKPRLELLVEKFGSLVQSTPRIVPSTREATFKFQSKQAHVQMKLSASTDRDIRKVILGYDLQIVPVLWRFNPHAEIEFPLDAVDRGAAAQWIDDRIVEFVQTYFSLGENETYLKDRMVEDPIAHVRFPRDAAATTLEWQGNKLYFIGEETRREFARQNNIALA